MDEFSDKINSEEIIQEDEIQSFIKLNPAFWKTYFVVGEYHFNQKDYKNALKNYEIALTKEITTLPDKELILKRIQKCERKIK